MTRGVAVGAGATGGSPQRARPGAPPLKRPALPWALLPLLGALLLVGCSNAPPTIEDTFYQLNLVRNPQSGRACESLSLFVDLRLDGGISDLDSIYLLSDTHELFWRLTSTDWDKSDREGRLWVGSNQIEMADGGPLPRGTYRVMVIALSGERAVETIELSAPPTDPQAASYPSLTIAEHAVEVRSPDATATVWIYNGAGDLIASRSGQPGTWPIAQLLPTNALVAQATSLSVYSYDRQRGYGTVSGPYPF